MNKQFKKIIIMFVMVLALMGIGAIQNGTIANAATVGEQLLQPEDSWKRYDNEEDRISYKSAIASSTYDGCYNSTYHIIYYGESVEFKFKGTKLRVIGVDYNQNQSTDMEISIDNNIYNYNCANSSNIVWQALNYEVTGLNNDIHTVRILQKDDNLGSHSYIDAIDIDKDGYLLDLNDISLTLDKSLTLKEGNSKKLISTTTQSAVDVEWSSSDETIATVDENGKVTGVKEGTCIITAQIKGTDVKATCEVTVTKEDIVEPDEPSIENGSLYIEMVDGNIKRADKSQIEKFKKWFISRDLDETESPIFKITNAKGNSEYLVHDKVVGFEIRE